MENLVDNIDKVHEQLISEKGINVEDLPTELQRKINGWSLLYARLLNYEDEKLSVTLKKKSVEIADEIKKHIETDKI
jgi:tRNA(His) 5'-end guanylyltransferase